MNKESNNKKLLGIIIIILILIIAIIIALIGITVIMQKSEKSNSNDVQENAENFLETYGKGKDGTVSNDAYFDVLNCINQYLRTINTKNDIYYGRNENGEYTLIVDENYIKEQIYNLLSEKYITQNEITLKNIYDKIETLDTSVLFVPVEISMIQDNSIKSFLIHGLIELPSNYEVISENFFIVNIDFAKDIYSIEIIKGDYTTIKDIHLEKLETIITEYSNNAFSPTSSNNESKAKEYIDLYKRLTLGAPEKIYEMLNKEYREAKFENIDGYKRYIQENRDRIIGINLQKYKVTYEDDYTQYVCIDQNNKYYIIRAKSVLDYEIMLDTYTVDLPEFVEKYEAASDKDKVLMNIQKFFDAIEDEDYKYAYNKLDNTFKSNYFKTEADFENYVKENFFDSNTLSAGSAELQGDIYLYNVTISDKTGKDSKTITKSFVMQLKEGTDFVMSFGVE